MSVTEEQMREFREKRYNATITHIEKRHDDLMVLRVATDYPRSNYLAGQYCTLGLANFEMRAEGCQPESLSDDDQLKLVRRSYSISSSVFRDGDELRDHTRDDWLEFYIVLVRENLDGRVPALTPRLFNLRVGDRLQVGEKITGHFTAAPVQSGNTVVFLSTGTGEAPHNSMLADLLRTGHTGKIIAACCVRFRKDLGYLETQERLMALYPQYRYLPLTTREASMTGKVYIQDLISSCELDRHLVALGATGLDPADAHVFLCGNPKMIGIPAKSKETGLWEYPQPPGVIEILEARGFRADNPMLKIEGNIHFEKYW